MKAPKDFYPDCTDAMLVSLARQNDHDAFEQIVIRQQSKIRHLFRSLCNDPSLADDLSQQAFLQAFIKMSDLRNEQAFNGWLKRLSINVWLAHCRKNDMLADAELTEELSAQARNTSLEIDLNSALQKLTAIERTCIVLSYQQGMSHKEIEEVTDLPLGTLKSHIRRGSQKLNDYLAAYTKPEIESE